MSKHEFGNVMLMHNNKQVLDDIEADINLSPDTDVVMSTTREQVIELSKVHNNRKCVGLPYCVSCRADVLIRANFDVADATERINHLGIMNSILHGGGK